MPSSTAARARLDLGTLLAALALALFAWGTVFDLGLFGWDTYPLIDAGRFASWDEFAHSLSCELMDGRFPGGHYWRPLVHLSFGLDYALWGLDPFGYHLTDFLLLVLGTTLVVTLSRALLGEGRAGWAWFAGLVFVLHPVHFEVLSLPPRRADSMALCFTLLALVLALRRPGQRSVGVALASLAAVASKETGALAPGLVFGFVALTASGPRSERALAGLKSAWLALALVGLFLAVRSQVVGGIGGGAQLEVPNAAAMGSAGLRYAELVLAPLPPGWMRRGDFGVALGLAMVLVLAIGLWRAQPTSVRERTAIEPRSAALAVGTWMLALVALTACSGVYRAWYALPLAAPLALFVALAAASRWLSGGGGSVRVLGAIFVLALLQGWASDSQTRWKEHEAASLAADGFLDHFDAVVRSLQPGSVAELAAEPPEGSASRHGEETRRALVFREYSLEAYAAIVHPGLRLRVDVRREGQAQTPAPDEILVLLLPKAPASARN
ncbi:MAG: hypothetical protein FJ294_04955 [Planctomycetes bacterium]|nr:hypothetical protein [Planctomycetota bacterium]